MSSLPWVAGARRSLGELAVRVASAVTRAGDLCVAVLAWRGRDRRGGPRAAYGDHNQPRHMKDVRPARNNRAAQAETAVTEEQAEPPQMQNRLSR
jgi:hypothetical protein